MLTNDMLNRDLGRMIAKAGEEATWKDVPYKCASLPLQRGHEADLDGDVPTYDLSLSFQLSSFGELRPGVGDHITFRERIYRVVDFSDDGVELILNCNSLRK